MSFDEFIELLVRDEQAAAGITVDAIKPRDRGRFQQYLAEERLLEIGRDSQERRNDEAQMRDDAALAAQRDRHRRDEEFLEPNDYVAKYDTYGASTDDEGNEGSEIEPTGDGNDNGDDDE